MDFLLFAASSALARAFLLQSERSSMGQSPSKKSALAPEAAPVASLLLQAAMQGDLAEIQTLVSNYEQQQGQDNPSDVATFLNDPTDDASGKNTAMHGAVFAGHLEIVQYLHEHAGVESLMLPNGLGCTPLWLAAGYNRLDILEYLLRHLPSNVLPEALLTTNSTGDTPLLAAASKGHVEICHRLLLFVEEEHGSPSCAKALIQTTNQNRDSPLSVAIAAGITPLLVACESDHLRAAQILLEANDNGEDVGNSSSSDDSPLGVAAFCGSQQVLKLLLFNKHYDNPGDEASSSPPPQLSVNFTHPRTGCTPLFLAVRAGHVACARLLLEAGADASVANQQGLTPLQAAEKYQASPAMLDLLQRQWRQQAQ